MIEREVTVFSDDLAARVNALVAVAAAQPDVRASVEANHDDNRWWPLFVTDWRIRMAVAGWSSRVSYSMIGTYASVVKAADAYGWDLLTEMDDTRLAAVVRPLGLTEARVRYLRSLQHFLSDRPAEALLTMPAGDFIAEFAAHVSGASFKIAQCAALYARGYHCGIIPIDSGMVSLLAPLLGIRPDTGAKSHERMRSLMESCAVAGADDYQNLIHRHHYAITVPDDAMPTWWMHLVLIYFKRHYLNRPTSPRLCGLRPVCPELLDCGHTDTPA